MVSWLERAVCGGAEVGSGPMPCVSLEITVPLPVHVGRGLVRDCVLVLDSVVSSSWTVEPGEDGVGPFGVEAGCGHETLV